MLDWPALRDTALAGISLTFRPPKVQLPALPYAVTLFAQRARDERVPLSDLAKILETDSGLTTQLLKQVNSAYLGVRQKIASVAQALSLLGCQQSRHFVIATGMEAAIRAHNSKLINQNSFWNTNLRRAIFSKHVALLMRTDPEIAFLGALLQDYLLPVLTNDLCDVYREFLQSANEDGASLSDFERAHFGWDHTLVGACLAYEWNFPDELICCIRFHHGGLSLLSVPGLGRSPVAATALSALLPDELCGSERGLASLIELQDTWPAFSLERLAETVDEQYLELGLGVQNEMPLLPLVRRLQSNVSPPGVLASE
jgi:HD-like signal output (HDOD) protein